MVFLTSLLKEEKRSEKIIGRGGGEKGEVKTFFLLFSGGRD